MDGRIVGVLLFGLVSFVSAEVYSLHHCMIERGVARCHGIMEAGFFDIDTEPSQIVQLLISRMGRTTLLNIKQSSSLAVIHVLAADANACSRIFVPQGVKLIINNQPCPQTQTTTNKDHTDSVTPTKNEHPSTSVESIVSSEDDKSVTSTTFSLQYSTYTEKSSTSSMDKVPKAVDWDNLSQKLKIILVCIIVTLVLIVGIIVNWVSKRFPKRCRPRCSCWPCGETLIYERRNRTDIAEMRL